MRFILSPSFAEILSIVVMHILALCYIDRQCYTIIHHAICIYICRRQKSRPSPQEHGGRGVWGGEFRRVLAKNRGQSRRPARSEQNTKEKFCFPFRRKNPARANPKMRTKLFFGVASVSERRRGGSVVPLKIGSCKV